MLIALHLLLLASPPQEPACVQELGELLARTDYDRILSLADACYKATKNPRPLYYMGAAELGKRRPERALAWLQRYLASDVKAEPPALLKQAADALDLAKPQVVDVTLQIKPKRRNENATVTIKCTNRDESLVMNVSEFDLRGGTTVALPREDCQVTVARAGFFPERRSLRVGQSSTEIFELEPRPLLVPEKTARNAWVGTWSAVGVGLAGAGIGVFAVAGKRSRELLAEDLTSVVEIDRGRKDLAEATMRRARGAGMLGAGLGVMVGGFTRLAPSKRTRKILFASELGLGGALAVTGLIFFRVARVSFNQVNNSMASGLPRWGSEFEELLNPGMRGYVAAAGLLGAGLGLGLSSMIGLVAPKLGRKRSGSAAQWSALPDGFAVKF